MLHWEVHDIQSAEIAAKFIEKAVEKVGFIKGDNTLIRADDAIQISLVRFLSYTVTMVLL